MVSEICNKSDCTACTACAEGCPVNCIEMKPDIYGNPYPAIDYKRCIDCKKCVRNCPVNKPAQSKFPKQCYAAWSNDSETRRNSASGGIASELYKDYIERGGVCAGVQIDGQGDCSFFLFDNTIGIELARNSKYTYSNPNGIYSQIKDALTHGNEVIFIGLPCQVAGLRNYLGKKYGNLLCVDLICHGVSSPEYLKQHIKFIEQNKNKKSDHVTFRDPKKGTYIFFFSLSSNGSTFYSKKVQDNDVYQIGYHSALIYRSNCYHCKYACPERTGDLTISDFSGLGRIMPFKGDKKNVSCILVNTPKGLMTLTSLSEKIETEERPLAEALDYEKQLKRPSAPHPGRRKFLEIYEETHDFETSAQAVLTGQIKKNIRRKYFHIDLLKRIFVKFTPSKLRYFIKLFFK